MSPTSRSRKRKRRAQLLVGRSVSSGEEPRRPRFIRSYSELIDDWLVGFFSTRLVAALLVLACGGAAVLAFFGVRADDDLRAYRNAPTCDASTATSTVCREEVPVTVTGVGTAGNSKSHYDYVDVSGLLLPQTQVRIVLRDRSRVRDIARAGDDATVELWHGSIVAITDDYVTSNARYTPRVRMVDMVSYSLVALAGAVLFGVCWLRLLRARPWPRWLMPLVPTAILATLGFFFAALIGSSAESLVVTFSLDGAIALAAAVFFAVRWRLVRPRGM